MIDFDRLAGAFFFLGLFTFVLCKVIGAMLEDFRGFVYIKLSNGTYLVDADLRLKTFTTSPSLLDGMAFAKKRHANKLARYLDLPSYSFERFSVADRVYTLRKMRKKKLRLDAIA